jgi:hypothetical protein
MICQTKVEWRDSIPCPWKTNEMREEVKKKKGKKKQQPMETKMQNTKHKRIPYSMMEIHIKSKKYVKKCPPIFLKNKHSLCHSFFKLILLLTRCQWLTVSSPISLNLPLNILDEIIHFSMTYLLHVAKASQHIQCTHNEQHDAKVSVKMISEKSKYFPTYTFHTSCEVRYLPHL